MSGLRERLRRLKTNALKTIVGQCPPELYACEVCGQTRCDTERWLKCEKRLAAAKLLESGENKALDELKKRHSISGDACIRGNVSASSACGRVQNG